MVAVIHESVATTATPWQSAFETMLPSILRMAQFALRKIPAHTREEALQDVMANCCLAFSRLSARGKAEQAFCSTLVKFAVSQYQSGRRVGNRLRKGDVLAPHAQFCRRFCLESLDRLHPVSGDWQEALLEDRRTCVADQAAFRVDFPAWLAQLSKRDGRLAVALSVGHTTLEVAAQFGLSAARVSQLRGELSQSWQRFHGEAGIVGFA